MAIWYRTVVGTRSELDLSRLEGKLADGIVFVRLKKNDLDELKNYLDLEDRGYSHQLLLLVREDLLKQSTIKPTKAFYFLAKIISLQIRISIDPDAFIIKPRNILLTSAEVNQDFRWNNIYSNSWPKLNAAYEKHKTTFELFSAATVTDRTDATYNIVNSVISLESLLLNGEKVENAYKLRMRGSFLLSSDTSERKLMYDFLKYAYEFRSSIVHSDDKLRRKLRAKFRNDFGLTLYEVNSELIKINRYILKLFLNDNEVIEHLDDIILSGGYKGETYKNSRMANRIKQRAKTFAAQEKKKRSAAKN